ncbi:MAG TPA: hypothetical protein VFQ61_28730 [Polyangiaceae bacterium]|nr:hypothetical protein [Polyangiaceae bacterium]
MLSPDVRVEGFSAEEWQRLGQIFRGPSPEFPHAEPRERTNGSATDRSADVGVGTQSRRGSGGLIALTDAGRLRKLLSTQRGRLDPRGYAGPLDLADLCARHGASWAVEVTHGTLERLVDRFAERLRPADTYLSQLLEFLLVLRELESEGDLRVFPWPVADWPIPTERAVVRAMEALCPVGRVALLGVFAQGELYTAAAFRRGASGIDAIVGPSELRARMGLLSGDWQRDYRFLASACETLLGPLALGCFGELFTFQTLAKDPAPGAWTSAVASREIVLSPVSPALALPLGLDAGRALWAQVRGLAERFGGSGWLGQASKRAPFDRLPAFESDVVAWLGFDPLRLLSRWMSARD